MNDKVTSFVADSTDKSGLPDANSLFKQAFEAMRRSSDLHLDVSLRLTYETFAASKMLEAAENGHVIAQFNIARMYEYGIGLAKNEEEAVKWYQMAAFEENIDAQYALGLMIDAGCGHEADPELATKWLLRAAKGGHLQAQFEYAMRCYKGFGAPQNDHEAFNWFHCAAKQDHATAQHNVGVMYLEGRGMEKSKRRAIYWLEKAARQDLPEALFAIGMIHLERACNKWDDSLYIHALKCIVRSASLDHPDAQYQLGSMFDTGEVRIPQNTVEAAYWLARAAHSDHAAAQYRYGTMLLEGGDDLIKDEAQGALLIMWAHINGAEMLPDALKLAKEVLVKEAVVSGKEMEFAAGEIPRPDMNKPMMVRKLQLH